MGNRGIRMNDQKFRGVFKHKDETRDIESELCNGCSYATRASWGKKCEAWAEYRADVERKESAVRRNGG